MKNNNFMIILFYIIFPISLKFDCKYLWIPLFLSVLGNYYFNHKEYSLKELIKNKVLKQSIYFLILLIIQVLVVYFVGNLESLKASYDIVTDVLQNMMFYHYVILFFIFYPLLKNISKNMNLCKYLIILYFVVSSLTVVLDKIPYLSYVAYFINKTNDVDWFDKTYCMFLYLFYYLNNIDLKKIHRYILYVFGCILFIIVIYLSSINQDYQNFLLNITNPFIIFMIIIIGLISKYEFGNIKMKNIPIYYAYPMISATLYIIFSRFVKLDQTIAICLNIVLSYLLCYVLSKNKKLKKLIVLDDEIVKEKA